MKLLLPVNVVFNFVYNFFFAAGSLGSKAVSLRNFSIDDYCTIRLRRRVVSRDKKKEAASKGMSQAVRSAATSADLPDGAHLPPNPPPPPPPSPSPSPDSLEYALLSGLAGGIAG